MRRSIAALLLCLAIPAVAGKPPSVSATAATTTPSEVTLKCTDDLRTFTGATGQSYGVTCPSGCTTGNVYGVGPYSDDSKVCRAAIHAGAISVAGGHFTLTVAAGQSRYAAGTAGGVTAQASRKHSRSFTVAGTSATSPPAGAASATGGGTRGTTAPAPGGGTAPAPAPAGSESQTTCQALAACCAALANTKPALVAGCSTIASAGVQSVCASTLESYRDALAAANSVIPAVCK